MKKKENVFKNIVFLLFFVIINAYIHNMLKYYLFIYEDMPEMAKASLYYIVVFTLLISAFTILISIIVFKVSINFTLLSAWIYGAFSLIIFSRQSSIYEETDIQVLTVCIINLICSVLLYYAFKTKNK